MRRRLRGDRLRFPLAAALAALIAVVSTAPAAAAPGALDPGFGGNGIGGGPLEPYFASTAFTAIAEAADGSLLATRDELVRRFTATGRLDPGFPPRRPAPAASPRAVQPDGKVLEPGEPFRIKRLNPDGSVDQSFHGGESEETGLFGVNGIEALPSGKILVAGTEVELMLKSATSYAVVVRLNPDGTVDRGFGDSGAVTLRTYQGQLSGTVRELLVQPDDGAIAVGQDFVSRIGAGGSVDAGFAAAAGALLGKARILAQRRSGEGVAVAGSTGTGYGEATGDDFFVAHLGAGGSGDPAYSAGAGIARIDAGADFAKAAMFAPDGSVVVGGGTNAYVPNCFRLFGCRRSSPVVARFDPAGNPDPAFGVGGLARIAPAAGLGLGAAVEALIPRARGGIVAGGTGAPRGTTAFLAALDPGGALVSEFGEGGVVTERDPRRSEQLGPPAMAIGPGGRILAAVDNNAGTVWGPSVIRYTRNGRLDRAFGEGAGFVSWPQGDAAALAVDRAGGSALLTTSPGQVTRAAPRGRISRRFNGGRPVALAGGPAHFHDIAIQPDGKILVAGTDSWYGDGLMLVARLLPNGRPDRRFGRRGYATVPCPGPAGCAAKRILLQGDGRILLAGAATGLAGFGSEQPSRIALGRLLPDGRPDRGFGGDGLAVLRVTAHSTATALALRGGRILVAGWALPRRGSLGVLARFRMDGSLDRGFGRRGVSRSFPRGKGVPVELFPAAGRLIVAMKQAGPPVLAFRPDGRPDRSYRRLPAKRAMPGLVSGPGATRQGGRVVLGWTRGVGKELIQLRLTRLAAG